MSAESSPRAPHASSWSTIHPVTTHDQTVMASMRAMAEPNKGKLRGVAARKPFDAIISHAVAPDGVSYREDRIGGVPGWWCEPAGALPDACILHLHGGWFNWGSAEAFRHLVGQIARSAEAKAFIPDYRLAPEHPFPAAANDARACLEGLIGLGFRAIAVTGDSAGGNLALTLLPRHGSRLAVDVWEGMAHGFLGSVGSMEAADVALRSIGTFLARRLAAGRMAE